MWLRTMWRNKAADRWLRPRPAGSLVAHTRRLALRRPLSAPGRAPGCPKRRSTSANQPLGPRWPAISAISALLRHRLRSASQPDYPNPNPNLTPTLTLTRTLTLTPH
eukprot:scaffold23062_cov55-Phaeocystis_antarctica.AAC.2